MSSRTPYLVSATLHALVLLALGSGHGFMPVDFHVRRGQSRPELSQAHAVAIVTPTLDSRLPPVPPEMVVQPAPTVPETPSTSREIPSAARLDHRFVPRPPVEERVNRRTVRTASAVPLARAAPAPLSSSLPSPQDEGRRLDPLWTAVPEMESPSQTTPRDQPPAVRPVTTTDVVVDPPSSVAQRAAMTPEGAEVERLPRPLPINREPIYPTELRRQRIGGRVILLVRIESDGHVGRVTVDRSSGQPLLDQAAMTAVQAWQFEPAQRGGSPVTFEVRLPINFRIRD